MKKKNLKVLAIKKTTISNLQMRQLKGGYKDTDTCPTNFTCASECVCTTTSDATISDTIAQTFTTGN